MQIKLKNKVCIECGRDDQPHFSKKRCKSCAQKSYKKPSTISDKGKIAKSNKKEILDPYFFYHLSKCTISENSKTPIFSPTKANICHLIDKGRHPSIMANLDNCIYLTIDEHTRFDKLLFEHRFADIEKEMPIAWEVAKSRYKKILLLCNEKTKFIQSLEEYLNN